MKLIRVSLIFDTFQATSNDWRESLESYFDFILNQLVYFFTLFLNIQFGFSISEQFFALIFWKLSEFFFHHLVKPIPHFIFEKSFSFCQTNLTDFEILYLVHYFYPESLGFFWATFLLNIFSKSWNTPIWYANQY